MTPIRPIAVRQLAAALAVCLPLCAAAAPSAPAAPTLLGDTITVSGSIGDSAVLGSATGVAGVDALSVIYDRHFDNTRFTPTFTATTIEIGFQTTFGTNAWFFIPGSYFEVSDIDALIVGASLSVTSSNTRLPVASDLSFMSHSVRLDMGDVVLRNGDRVLLTLVLSEAPAGVPEPSSIALVGLALAGVAGSTRRRLAV